MTKPTQKAAPYGRCAECGEPLTYDEYHFPSGTNPDLAPFEWPNICDACADKMADDSDEVDDDDTD